MNNHQQSTSKRSRVVFERRNGPYYRQLSEHFRLLIEGDDLPAGAELPKEADIAEHYGVSLMTVRNALKELEQQGLIQKRPAKPAVVLVPSVDTGRALSLRKFTDMAYLTRNGRLEVLNYGTEASPVFRQQFGAESDPEGYCLRAILITEGVKRSFITCYLPNDVGANLSAEEFDDPLIFNTVQKHLGIRLEAAHLTIRAEVASSAVAEHLGIEKGYPVLSLEMLYETALGRRVEYTVGLHRSDFFRITYDSHNDIS